MKSPRSRGSNEAGRFKIALSGKYGKLNIPDIGKKEPVFILRARDKLVESAIKMYLVLATLHGCQPAEGLQREIDSFWQ